MHAFDTCNKNKSLKISNIFSNSGWLGQAEEEGALRLPSTLRPLAFLKVQPYPTSRVSLHRRSP